MGNLHQFGIAMEMYIGHQPLMPPYLSALYPDHMEAKELYVCPADPTDGLEGSKPKWHDDQYPETDELATNRAGEQAFEQEHYGADAYTVKFAGEDKEPYRYRNQEITAGSYTYEFSVARCPFGQEWGTKPDQRAYGGNGDGIVDWREYKNAAEVKGLNPTTGEYTNEAYGLCVPVIRCFYHARSQQTHEESTVLNLAGHHGTYRSDRTGDGWKRACKPGAFEPAD